MLLKYLIWQVYIYTFRFCRKLCYYCDFHFTVSLRWKDRLINALVEEIRNRTEEGEQVVYDTVYFGGGTPSILSVEEINKLYSVLNECFSINNEAEVSLEANPDDLTEEYLNELKNYSAVNRLSIGVQAFQDKHLVVMNRRHDSREAKKSIELASEVGFSNINIDLIYGVPGMSSEDWSESLNIFSGYKIPHLSAYHLTFEPKTVFSHYLKKGKINILDEEQSVEQYNMLIDFADVRKYDHYEISNFAIEGFHSRHNLGYWNGKHYLGFGPSSHSFNGKMRRWNLANNSLYMQEIENKSEHFHESEVIDKEKAFNEYMLTALRTKWGIILQYIKEQFGEQLEEISSLKVRNYLKDGLFEEYQENFRLSQRGKIISDYIISEMMET